MPQMMPMYWGLMYVVVSVLLIMVMIVYSTYYSLELESWEGEQASEGDKIWVVFSV